MMADKIREEDLKDVDLKSWTKIVNCSEPVRHESHRKFQKRFEPFGLAPTALSTCYAMAETTFAVTQSLPDAPPTVLAVNRTELSRGRVEISIDERDARFCVSSGTPIAGCDVRIVDDAHGDLPDGQVGELVIRSASMFDGYRNYPEKTAEVLQDGWYFSGDLGFKNGEEYFVVGRKKDIIIVAGNNIYPEDVEAAVGTVHGVIPGRVVAFGQEQSELGTERLCVMAETEITDETGLKRLRMDILKAGMAIDVTIAGVILFPPRFLIKSSAGKMSRQANKDRVALMRDLLTPIVRRGL
jgi:acyl-CoA synthetase (AMP-forming)/AMP-acid ligase II